MNRMLLVGKKVHTDRKIFILAFAVVLCLLGAVTTTAMDVNIEWDANPAGENVTHYRIYYSTNEADFRDLANLTFHQIDVDSQNTSESITYEMKGLPDDVVCPQRFYFGITALNAHGESEVSELVDTIRNHPDELMPPAEPVLEATEVTPNSVALKWDKPVDDVCVVRFRIMRNSESLGFITTTTDDLYAYTDVDLTPATTYTYTIRAYDGADRYSESQPLVVVTTTPGPQVSPGIVKDVTAEAEAYNRIRITWSARPANEQITAYTVQRISGTSSQTFTVTNGTEYLDENVEAKTVYEYAIRAINDKGEGDWSDPAAITTPAVPEEPLAKPGLVEGFDGEALSANTINLSWTPSPTEEQVQSYEIERSAGTTKVSYVPGITDNSYRDENLQAGTTYRYRIRAVNTTGSGPWSDPPVEVITPKSSTIPDTKGPEAPVVNTPGPDEIQPRSVTLTWSMAKDIGPSGIAGYQVFDQAKKEMLGTTDDLTFTVTGLTPETAYTFYIRAVDNAGNNGDWSDTVQVTTAVEAVSDDQPPETPAGLAAVSDAITPNAITLQWAACNDVGNAGIDKYEIFIGDTTHLIGDTTDTEFTADDLEADTEYTFYVRALDKNGNVSEHSEGLTVKTIMALENDIGNDGDSGDKKDEDSPNCFIGVTAFH